jgi:hypothetical protein
MPNGMLAVPYDTRVAAVECRMTAFDPGVAPAEAMLLQGQLAERRTERPPWKEPRSHIVHESGTGGLFRANCTTGSARMGLEDENVEPGAREYASGYETIGPRADKHRIRITLALAYDASGTSQRDLQSLKGCDRRGRNRCRVAESTRASVPGFGRSAWRS